jgi:translation initiation factor 1 (eIF-1/SUI1)
MDSGGYTYAQIENKGKKTWVAVPKTKIVKGKNISFVPGMEMQNFESKTLKRTFDRIIFSGGVSGQQGK